MRRRGAARWRGLGAIAVVTASMVIAHPVPVSALTTVDAAGSYGYPYPNAPDCNEQNGDNCVADRWGFVQGQCHSWVAYRLNELNASVLHGATFNDWYRQPGGDEWGSTWHWGDAAAAAGIAVNDTPALGSVAWWSNDGGHVGYVEAVNGDGSVTMSEMNFDLHNNFDFTTLRRGQRWPTGFIHIADRPAQSAPGAPTNVRGRAGDHQVSVYWNAPAAHGSAITHYVVRTYRGAKIERTVTIGAVDHLTVGNLTDNVAYAFTVHAANRIGIGPVSARSKTVTPVA